MGRYPKRGKILWGFTGWETVEEFSRVIPHVVNVKEKSIEFRAAALCVYEGNPIVVS